MTIHLPNRRQEIINTAKQLFYLNGYESTSINNILQEMGVSKGALYHYFGSKLEILEAIVEQMMTEAASTLQKIATDPNLSASEKLVACAQASFGWKTTSSSHNDNIYQSLQSDSNVLLHHKLQQQWSAIALPELETILQQGVSKQQFNVEHISNVARILLMIISDTGDQLKSILATSKNKTDTITDIQTLLSAMQTSCERLVAMKPGTLILFTDTELQTLIPENPKQSK